MSHAEDHAPAAQHQARAEDIVPWLLKSPEIVTKLGVCVTISCLKDVSRIRLNNNGIEGMRDDLSSNLIRITHAGQKGFTGAHKILAGISLMTKRMSEMNGLLDKLEERMTNLRTPRDLEACKNYINMIEKFINKSLDGSKSTAEEFQRFEDLVNEVEMATANAWSRTSDEHLNADKHIKIMKARKELQEVDIAQKEEDKNQATSKYNAAIQNVFQKTSGFKTAAVGTGVTTGAGLVGTTAVALGATAAATAATSGIAAVGIVATLILSAITSENLSKASEALNVTEDRLAGTRKAYNELEMQLQESEGELKLLAQSEKRLFQAMKAITQALSLLRGLVCDISALITKFNEMSVQMSNLLDAYDLSEMSAGLIEDAFTANEAADAFDIRDFKQQMVEMKKTTIIIRGYSDLYSCLIRDVVIPGFGQAKVMSQGASLLENTKEISEIVEEKFQAMNGYLQESDATCRHLAKLKMTMMNDELKRVKRVEDTAAA